MEKENRGWENEALEKAQMKPLLMNKWFIK